ncbi:MAG: YlbF family regulator [Clostridiales bacterium]|nr:YlbF family regulator [Clostridiales bacterium]
MDRKEVLQQYLACEQALRENPALYATLEEYEGKSSALIDMLASGSFGAEMLALSEDVSRLNEILQDNPQITALRAARSELMQLGCGGNACGQCCNSSGCKGCKEENA